MSVMDSPQFCPQCGTRTRVVRTFSASGRVLRNRFCEECAMVYRTKELLDQAYGLRSAAPAQTPPSYPGLRG